MYSKTLTFIVASTCLNTSVPEGGAGSDSSEGPMHGWSLLVPCGLLALCLNLGWTLSSEEDEDGVVSVDQLSSHHSKLVSMKKKYRNIRCSLFAKTKFSSAKNTKLAQFQNVP